MKKLVFICLSLIFILVSCSKETSVKIADVQESPNYLYNNYYLCESLYDLYFDFFNGEINEDEFEAMLSDLCYDYGFDIDFDSDCEVSEICQEYSIANHEMDYISIDVLCGIFENDDLTEEEKLLLLTEAVAINYYNRYKNCVLVMETSDGNYLIENNPICYIEENNINVNAPYVIIYQPYSMGEFSVSYFHNDADFFTHMENNNYYANEETEIDCLHTYKENVERVERNLKTSIIASTPFLFIGGPKSYAAALLCCLIEYKLNKDRCWDEFVDCLESVQEVIFIQP